MAKYQAKTTENKNSVAGFLKGFPIERQKDAKAIIKMMELASGLKAKMWGPAIIGFGSYHYKYASGHEGTAPLLGFSPRKTDFTLYLSTSFKQREELLHQLGKSKTSKHCLYIRKLEDIDTKVLEKMIHYSFQDSVERHSKGTLSC